MQVVVSMYLDTTGSSRSPVFSPRSAAECCRISSWGELLIAPSRLLQLDQEGLVFRSPGVGVHRGRRQHVGERAGVTLGARKAPVDRKPDLPDLLAVDLERGEPLG